MLLFKRRAQRKSSQILKKAGFRLLRNGGLWVPRADRHGARRRIRAQRHGTGACGSLPQTVGWSSFPRTVRAPIGKPWRLAGTSSWVDPSTTSAGTGNVRVNVRPLDATAGRDGNRGWSASAGELRRSIATDSGTGGHHPALRAPLRFDEEGRSLRCPARAPEGR